MLELLRKFGILRYGVKKAKFTSGKDLPPEFLMDDVYDAEKDLVNKEDIEKASQALKKSKCKAVFKWIILGIAGFLLFFFVLGVLFGTDESTKQEPSSAVEKKTSGEMTNNIGGQNRDSERSHLTEEQIKMTSIA